MGVWERFATAPSGSGLGSLADVEYLGSANGWDFGRLDMSRRSGDSNLVDVLGAPVLEGFVMDSDFAAIASGAPGAATSWLAVNIPVTDDADDPLATQWLSPTAR